MSMPLSRVRPMMKAVYASIVHQSVCEFTGGDGFGQCYLYTIGGFVLLVGEKHSPAPHPQAGSLLLLPDQQEPDHWFTLDASDGGAERGEYHTWLMSEDGTVVDFSARHYRRYAEELLAHSGVVQNVAGGVLLDLTPDDDRPTWKRTEHYDYLWGSIDQLPSWVRFGTDLEACMAFSERFQASFNEPDMRDFRALVWSNRARLMPR